MPPAKKLLSAGYRREIVLGNAKEAARKKISDAADLTSSG
jgi:hypothetical protein